MFAGSPPIALEGEYWTDRNTKGELVFHEFSKRVHYDFVSASKGRFKNLRP
jgi:hypothetical protein